MSFDSPLPPYNASDPTATFLNSSCLDLLLIELVPMAYRLVNELDAGEKDGMAGLPSPAEKEKGSVLGGTAGTAAGTMGTVGTVGTRGEGSKMDEDEERDAVFYRLEMLGYRVGQGLVERYVLPFFCRLPWCSEAINPGLGWEDAAGNLDLHWKGHALITLTTRRFSRDRPRFTDTLDVIKFLCKDLWMLVFRKQIDNLKTNHRVRLLLSSSTSGCPVRPLNPAS